MATKRTVTVWLSGGLGNQLYQYAAARRLALRNQADLVLDARSGFAGDPYRARFVLDRFSVAGAPSAQAPYASRTGRVRRRIRAATHRWLPLALRSYVAEADLRVPADLLHLRLWRDVYLDGSWMDEVYFRDIRSDLLQELDVRGPHGALNDELAARIQDTMSVAVHVRRLRGRPNTGPSEPLPDDPDRHLSRDYYHVAVKRLIEMAGVDHSFVFADYPAWAEEHLRLPIATTFVTHNGNDRDYEDFWLMRQCKHFVIANSTFSWWAAWLGQTSNKQVVVPAGYVDPMRGLHSVPDHWIRI
jgi:hypothetical protein